MIKQALAEHDLSVLNELPNIVQLGDVGHLPQSKRIPVIGSVGHFIRNGHKLVTEEFDKYGPVFVLNALDKKAVFLSGPDANQLVLKNQNEIFSNYMAWHHLFEGVFDNALLERDFTDHKVQRKILQAAFKRDLITGYVHLMGPQLETTFARWPQAHQREFMPSIKKILLNVAAEVFLGTKTGRETDSLNEAFTNMVASTTDLFRLNIPFTPYYKGKQGRKTLSKYILKNIPEKRHANTSDFFTKICQLEDDDGELFTDKEIRDHMNFLLFAAHDTTTSTLSSLMYSLATHSSWQEELRNEIRALDTDAPTIDDLEKMELAGLVMRETLRMYPPLSFIFRFALEEFDFAGYRIPANTPIGIAPVHTHHMPEYWSNPNKFDPERFTKERAEDKKHLYQWIPFGGGAHKCLGLYFAEIQVKLVLFHLLKNFRVTKKSGSQYKYNNVPLTFPTNGLPLRFERV